MNAERLYQLNARLETIERNIEKAAIIMNATDDTYRKWYNAERQKYIENQADEAARIMNEISKCYEPQRSERSL